MKKLVLYLGKHDPDETHLRRQDRCVPNAKFWRPFVSGMSFPDLRELEVRHYWATIPPENASLDTGDQHDVYGGYTNCHDVIGQSDGLTKLERIVLESPPELNSAVLMQLVGNPKAMASNLTTLDLRFCQLDHDTIAQLLYHAPPKLQRVSLLCGNSEEIDHGNRRGSLYGEREESLHLCPLIRVFSKGLVHLDYSCGHVCRRLFFDEEEIDNLKQHGITTKIGDNHGQETDSEVLDAHAIRKTIESSRQSKKTAAREDRVKEALEAARSSRGSLASTSLFGGCSKGVNPDAKVRRDTENLIDEEDEQRRRLVQRSNTKWFRRVIAWDGLCMFGDTWSEMKLAADMEEEAVEWVLASKQTRSSLSPIMFTGSNRTTRQGAPSRKPAHQR